MEDEILEGGKPITPPSNPTADSKNDLLNRLNNAASGRVNTRATSAAYGGIEYNSEVGKSKYDEGLISSIDLDPENAAKSLQEYRARQQPTSHQIANAAAKLLPNIALGTIGTIASALDIEDYVNSDQEVGNWLTNLTTQGQDWVNGQAPIYRANPDKPLDLADGGWWVSSLSSLGESIGSFALGGGILAKGLVGFSKLVRAQKLAAMMIKGANKLPKVSIDPIGGAATAGEITGTVLNAMMLNQAEGILEATDVQKEIYEKYVDELGEEGARQRASEAATTVISTNRLNIMLNLSSANLFFKGTKFSRRQHHLETTKRSLGRGLAEGSQESVEEIINLIAGSRGRAKGNNEDYTAQDVINDVISMEALEAAVLGFVGGMGQTVVTTEGVNRLMKTGDPDNPGQKISIREFNKKQFEKYQEHIDEIKSTDLVQAMKSAADKINISNAIVDIDNKVKNLREQGKNDEALVQEQEAEKLRDSLVDVQAFDSFQKGTADHLIKLYEGIQNSEQKEGYPDNYKELAGKQVQKIKSLEKIYNRAMSHENGFAVYMNRAGRESLKENIKHYEDKASVVRAEMAEEIALLAQDHNITQDAFGFPVIEELTDDTPKDYREAVNAILDTDAYYELDELYETIRRHKTSIKDLDSSYKTLTSSKAQEKAKKDKENFKENLKKKQEAKSEAVEAKAKEEIKTKAKEKKIVEQKEAEKTVKKKKEAKVEAIKSEYDNIINGYAIGENVPMPPNVPDEYKDQDAILESVDEAKGVIVLMLFDGKRLELSKDDNNPRITDEGTEAGFSTEGGENFTYQRVIKDNQEEGEVGGAKVISTYDDGTPLSWMATQYPEYLKFEREPRNKKGEKVGFQINNNIGVLKSRWIDAINILKHFEKTGQITEKQTKFLYAYLPMFSTFGGNVKAPIETLPDEANLTEGDRALENFKEHSLPLRQRIIDAMLAGNSIDTITGRIQDQFKGVLKVDTTPVGTPAAENNILDLHAINGDISKVKLFMVNDKNNLVNTAGEIRYNNIEGKGEVYAIIPRANGEDFTLKLNVKRIQQNEAEALYRLFQMRMNQKDVAKATSLKELANEDRQYLEDKIKDVIDVIATTKRRKDITLKDLTDFLVWDKSTSPKSQVRLFGSKLLFGDQSAFGDEVNLQKNKDAFIKFLVENKRHHIKFKAKKGDMNPLSVDSPAYKEYLIKNGILNTNAVVGEPTFQGRTHIYLEKDITVAGKEKPSKPEAKTKIAAKEGKSPEDIHAEILERSEKYFNEKYFEYLENMDEEDAMEKAAEDQDKFVSKLQEELLGGSSAVAPLREIEVITEEVISEVIETKPEEIRKSDKDFVSLSKKDVKPTTKLGTGLGSKKRKRGSNPNTDNIKKDNKNNKNCN